MLNIRTIDGHGSDDPQRRDYKKSPGAESEKPNKQIASENLPSMGARATITGGDIFMRAAGFYGKGSA